MPKKTMPKPMAGYNARWVPKDEDQRIEAAVSAFGHRDISLTDNHKEQLKKAAKFYFWDIHTKSERPTMSECRNALKKLMTAAQQFENALESLDRRTYELLKSPSATWDARIKDKKSASNWCLAAMVALHEIRDKKDKTKKADYALQGLLSAVAGVYEDATGKKARLSRKEGTTPVGPFFRLAKDFLIALQIFKPNRDGSTGQHDEAIYHAAGEALKNRRSPQKT